MSLYQPEESEPSDPIVAVAKRVTVGSVMEPGTTLPAGGDKYIHFQTASDYATPAKCKPEGFRAVCGPYGSANATTLKIVRYPRTYDISSFDQSPEIDAGYASLWGWRPYIRLQRISIAAEGSWIIVQRLTDVTDRILLVRTETGNKVVIWDNSKPNSDPAIHNFTGDSVFVDVTYTGPTTPFTFTLPASISSNSDASALLTYATSKMK